MVSGRSVEIPRIDHGRWTVDNGLWLMVNRQNVKHAVMSKTILVTGATGKVGRVFVDRLLDGSKIRFVHCAGIVP